MKVKEFVEDLKKRGCYTKAQAIQEVMVEFEYTYQRAHYYVKRYW